MQRALVIIVPLLAACFVAGNAFSADVIGEPWEQPIMDGVRAQEKDRETKPPAAILRQAELLAARRTDPLNRVVRLYLLARAYGIAGDIGSARAAYRELLQLAPKCYFAYHDLGILSLTGEPPDTRGAERYLRQAVGIHPRFVLAYKKLARLLLESKREREALPFLRRVVEIEPDALDSRYVLARTLLGLGQLDEAEREIKILYRKDRKNPAALEMLAQLYIDQGKLADAKKVYRRLSEQYPTALRPLQGYYRVIEMEREKNVVDADEWLWVLEGLYRLSSDPEHKKTLKEGMEQLRQQKAQGARPPVEAEEGPPSDARLVQILDVAPADIRIQALQYVYARPETPEQALLAALLRRLSAKVEPAAENRQWVLRILGRFGGFGLVGLVRHSLADPDPAVRASAVDALLALSETGNQARGAALLSMGLYTESRDHALAGAARSAVATLGNASLPTVTADTEDARRRAFLTWWRGPVAAEAKIGALEFYADVRDPFPEDVLGSYMKDPDPHVVDAAWREMQESAKQLLAGGRLSPSRQQWFRALPPYREGAARRAEGRGVRLQLQTWVDRKPGS